MTWDIFQSVWPVLAVLAYFFATMVLLVLASQHGRAIAIHQRIRESKALRHQYLAAIKNKEEQQQQRR